MSDKNEDTKIFSAIYKAVADQDAKCVDAGQKFLNQSLSVLSKIRVPSNLADAVSAILHCQGTVITTGMGKAGHAARKCSSSLCSLSFKSSYVHPGDAAHGDIGIAGPSDVMLAFSTSGKTREVLETIDFARNLGVGRVVSITSHPDSPIREMSDVVVDMGEVVEAGHLSLAPTTSILVMLLFADMIALVAAEIKGVTREQYGVRHHGGYLGQKCRGEA